MEATKYKIEYTNVQNNGAYPVIVAAAGSSIRMNGISKQFVSLCGIPAIIHTLSVFERCERISKIILVTKNEFSADMQALAKRYGISKLTDIVDGGENRQESVKNGLQAVKNEKFALIHDGARPLVTEKIIDSVISKLGEYDCVACGVRVKDTIKQVDKDAVAVNTVDRSNLISVQTPQGVNVEKYLKIIENSDLSRFTDDASVFESAGIPVKIVEGDYQNIKITTPEDILLAEHYLERSCEEL